MKTRKMILRCEHGLHGRVAARVVKLIHEHEAIVHIQCEGCPRVSACSILQLMTLGAERGARMEVSAEGPDEGIVVEAVAGIFAEGDGI